MNLKKQLSANGDRELTQEEAVAACQFYYKQTKMIAAFHMTKEDKINYTTINFLNDLKYQLLKQKFKEDVNK